jgi:hypothetical protein
MPPTLGKTFILKVMDKFYFNELFSVLMIVIYLLLLNRLENKLAGSQMDVLDIIPKTAKLSEMLNGYKINVNLLLSLQF